MKNIIKIFRYTLFTFLVGFSDISNAQEQANYQRIEKKALQHLESEEWYLAAPLFEQINNLKPESGENAFLAGKCFFQIDNKAESLKYFVKALKLGHDSEQLNFYLGRAYHFNLLFDSAIFHYTEYLSTTQNSIKEPDTRIPTVDEVNQYIKNCRFGKLLMESPVNLKIENVGLAINTEYPEYAPVISADEKLLMFTTRRKPSTGAGLNREGRYYEDIYFSKKNESEWEMPQNIGNNINTKFDDACIGLSPDGSKLLIFNGLNGGDIYISEFKDDSWTKPSSLEGDINLPSWEGSASFTLDENIIYFSSDRDGGYGGSDVYYSRRLPDGTWGKAVNLGPVINTDKDEDAPQIHINGKTLFFSSKGHDGIGGFDIFSSTLNLVDSSWTKPKNIGFPINTADDDIYFSLTADGSKGYFTSYRNDGYGEQDLYIVHRPLSSPHHVILKGKVLDKNKNPLVAMISLTSQKDQIIEKVIKSDPKTGSYLFEMSFDKDYNLTVEVDGYFYFTENINIENQPDIFEFIIDFTTGEANDFVVEVFDGSESAALKNTTNLNNIQTGEVLFADNKVSKDKTSKNIIYRESVSYIKDHEPSEEINPENPNRTQKAGYSDDKYVTSRTLTPLEKGQKVVLNNLYFDFNKSTLTAESTVELNNLFNLLKKYNSLYAEISGHTDNIGSKKFNKRLSERRAKAVQDYLVYKGIDKKRLSIAGYGDEKPLVNNITPEGRKINRRTEFEILNFDKNLTGDNSGALQEEEGEENQDFISGRISDAALPFKAHFLFNDGKYLTEYSKKRLNRILEFAKYEKDLSLIIVGYEDIDTEDHNKNLSNLRAESVYEYLIRNGLSKERIKILSEKRNFLPSETGIKRRKVEFYLSRS